MQDNRALAGSIERGGGREFGQLITHRHRYPQHPQHRRNAAVVAFHRHDGTHDIDHDAALGIDPRGLHEPLGVVGHRGQTEFIGCRQLGRGTRGKHHGAIGHEHMRPGEALLLQQLFQYALNRLRLRSHGLHVGIGAFYAVEAVLFIEHEHTHQIVLGDAIGCVHDALGPLGHHCRAVLPLQGHARRRIFHQLRQALADQHMRPHKTHHRRRRQHHHQPANKILHRHRAAIGNVAGRVFQRRFQRRRQCGQTRAHHRWHLGRFGPRWQWRLRLGNSFFGFCGRFCGHRYGLLIELFNEYPAVFGVDGVVGSILPDILV